MLAIDSRYLLAAAYSLAGQPQQARQVLPVSYAGEQSNKAFGGSFYSYIRDEGLALSALMDIDPGHPQVGVMARQVADKGVCVNNLLPGIHDTNRATSLDAGVSQAQGISPDQARRQREATIPTRSYGRAEDFGAACAFLCSQQARFIVGQNLLLDGGALNVTI